MAVVLENQREVRSVITRNQNGAIVGAKDVRENGDVFATEIGPIVSALVSNDDGEKKKKKNTKELESLKNAIARDGGKLVADAKAYEMALNDLERRVRGRRERSVPVRGEDARFDETKSSDSERGGENGGGKI